MKQGIRLAALAVVGVLLTASLTGCTHGDPSPSDEAPTRIYAIKGPTGVGMVNLMEEAESGVFDFHIAASAEEVTARVLNGEADIAAVPTNLAAVLHQKTGGRIQIAAVNTLGVLYVLEKGGDIRTVSDLRGKTVYSIGQGANPEYVLNYVLTQNGLTPGVDVTVEFREQAEELATLLASDKAAVAMLPEPSVTTALAKNDGLRVALDMTAEWEAAAQDESRLMMGCLIVSADYVQKNPDRMKTFLSDYRSSVEKALSDVEGTAVLCEKYEIIPKAEVARQAIPRCGLTYVDGEEMQRRLAGYYAVLHAANPQSVGGRLPDDAFYYRAS
ncbi:MAG: ABC transporter substrate-binding protein [Clostridiales bacterium]|nr:ABC transporter substrate-binding protein [Clostridiales bacterium]